MAKRTCVSTGLSGVYVNISKMDNLDSGYIKINAKGKDIAVNYNDKTVSFSDFAEMFSVLENGDKDKKDIADKASVKYTATQNAIWRGKKYSDNLGHTDAGWVYGYLLPIKCGNGSIMYTIYDENTGWCFAVMPDTLGQFIGETDKTGKRIFTGDYVQFHGQNNHTFEIIFRHGAFVMYWLSQFYRNIRHSEYEPVFKNVSVLGEIVGNIYDNHEHKEQGIYGNISIVNPYEPKEEK